MGYNTTVVFFNDDTETIENDPDYGKKLASAIRRVANGPVDVPGGRVVETHHADYYSVMAVGNNTAEELGAYYLYGDGELKLRAARALADELGYDLHRKRGR